MSKREWKPGDVAVYDGGRVIRVDPGDDPHWVDDEGDARRGSWPDRQARPLVVIDPEDSDQVERLMDGVTWLFSQADVNTVQAALREFANPTPPKPDEPQGLGAVVEDADGVLWIKVYAFDGHCARNSWAKHGEVGCVSDWRNYSDIDVASVLSEGVPG